MVWLLSGRYYGTLMFVKRHFFTPRRQGCAVSLDPVPAAWVALRQGWSKLNTL